MSILDLQNSKALEKVGRVLGREGIALMAIDIAKQIVKTGSYKNAIEGIGRMMALSQTCNWDNYWKEKRLRGKTKETERLLNLPESVDWERRQD